MNSVKSFIFLILPGAILLFFGSCGMAFRADNYTAYFGGEVTNPVNRYVVFMQGDQVIDSIPLDDENRFFKQFDSLAPGLYTFKHEPEYQYVYFDKNDSLLVSINSRDFDESIVFTGRGDQKNNFLMEMYLRDEKERDSMLKVFNYDIKTFISTIDQTYNRNREYYLRKKEQLKWSENFDKFAKASIDFPYYSKRELYPMVHKVLTGNRIMSKLPNNYYDFRKNINYSDESLKDFSPFVKYLSHMLNNIAATKYRNDPAGEAELALKTNTSKMDIADTMIRNEDIKNTILNNIAFTYLMEDQNMANNQQFLAAYHKYSTDKSQKNEITKIGRAIKLLADGNPLPEITFIDQQGNSVSSESFKKSTVIFFWTEKAVTHLMESHRKALGLKKKYPNYDFIAINLDDDQEKWKQTLSNYKFDGITQLRTTDFEDLRMTWAITKIHRTLVLNPDGSIKSAFTNLFDNDFEAALASESQSGKVAK